MPLTAFLEAQQRSDELQKHHKNLAYLDNNQSILTSARQIRAAQC